MVTGIAAGVLAADVGHPAHVLAAAPARRVVHDAGLAARAVAVPLALVGGLADAAPALAVDGAVLDAAALGRAPPAHAHLVLKAVPHSGAPRCNGKGGKIGYYERCRFDIYCIS